MTIADRDKWEEKYAAKEASQMPAPDEWLVACVRGHKPGRALDLACGLGQNAMALAKLGWEVDAVDISPCGLRLAEQNASAQRVRVNWICADLDEWEPVEQSYDLVMVFRFLDWGRIPGIAERGLKPGGLLCYETFASSQMSRPDSHLKNSAFTVQEGDWGRYFPGFEVISEESGRLPDRDVARMRAVRVSSNSG